MLRNQVLCYG